MASFWFFVKFAMSYFKDLIFLITNKGLGLYYFQVPLILYNSASISVHLNIKVYISLGKSLSSSPTFSFLLSELEKRPSHNNFALVLSLSDQSY